MLVCAGGGTDLVVGIVVGIVGETFNNRVDSGA